ncbi:unnamed protein product [Mytilus coruscus]|uniref:B box-type domain-containing protein n=1 Tax=Mytilus coruscus TaxID=42192 RepID=A0A6J8CK31_MYTCO|nr:unnamed protein product [Mytilus coruscus]
MIHRLDPRNVLCLKHKEKCSIYCKMCLKPGCLLCAPLHAYHEVVKIEIAYEDQISKLYQVMVTTDKEVRFLNDNITKIYELILPANLEYYNEIKLRIEERENKMKEMVSNEAKTLIKKLDETCALKEKELLDQREKFTSNNDILKQRKVNICETFQSHLAISVMDTISKIDVNPLDKKAMEISDNTFAFTFPHEPQSSIKFGSLIKILTLHILQTYDISYTTLMKSLPDGTIVVREGGTLRYMYFTDSEVVPIETKIFEKLPIENMTVCETGDILFTISDTFQASGKPSDIMCSKANGQIEKITTIKPEVIFRGIHATSHNIFVGYDSLDINVLILDIQGNVIVTLKAPGVKREIKKHEELYYDDGEIPWKLTTNINGDILIMSGDCCESLQGKVIALDRTGQFKWVYFGVESFFFGPSFIETTSNGLILVLNRFDYSIHVVSMEGEFLTMFGDEEGINNPHCLHIDQDDQLYIASHEDGECVDKILIAKLCI